MKHLLTALFLFAATQLTMAHEGGHHHQNLQAWTIETQNTTEKGSFLMLKEGRVYLETENGEVASYALSDFSEENQTIINRRYEAIQKINSQQTPMEAEMASHPFIQNPLVTKALWVFGILFLTGAVLLLLFRREQKKVSVSLAVASLLFITLAACNKDTNTTDTLTDVPANEVSALQGYFSHFSNVSTSSDNTYFRVASDGIPDHTMMTGITAWIAQVPIPQPYTGNNAWSIPLQPVLTDDEMSITSDFRRGAIGIAVNGIPIFNPINASGLVSQEIGELDEFGGHSGRADDYHYHTAPLHLSSTVGAANPIAYAFDGFAVYGELEPDGSAMEDLDTHHGHAWNGNYHYHGTSTYPYMVASMRGKVTVSGTAPETQVEPQAATTPLRTTLHPINGDNLLITSCQPNGSNNGYLLQYTIGGQPGSVEYSWDASDLYTYIFTDIDGSVTTEHWQR
ncbi:MAG: YHYH protein [Flavobacteriales bacterium]|nr:YHYH protein [Flavobacteriales bacterium]